MRRVSVVFLLLFCASCTDFWSGANKRRFREACRDASMEWAHTRARAEAYCDCVLDKMMLRYPNEIDAFAHIDSLAKDTSLIGCMSEIR